MVSTPTPFQSGNTKFRKKSVKGAIHTSLIKAMFATDRFPIQMVKKSLSIVFGMEEGIDHTKTRCPKTDLALATRYQR